MNAVGIDVSKGKSTVAAAGFCLPGCKPLVFQPSAGRWSYKMGGFSGKVLALRVRLRSLAEALHRVLPDLVP